MENKRMIRLACELNEKKQIFKIMSYIITCPHCKQFFEMDETLYKQIENKVLRDYFDNLKGLKEQVEKERQNSEQLKQKFANYGRD